MTTPPPPYSPIGYIDDDPTTPVSAANLNKTDLAVKTVTDWARVLVPLADLAGPGPTNPGGGVATTDASGVGEQTPKAHTHQISVKDGTGGGTEQHVDGIDFYGASGSLAVVGGRAQFHAEPADVRVIRLGWSQGTPYSSNYSIAGTTPTAIPDFNVAISGAAPGDHFDYDLYLVLSSSSASKAAVILQAPSAADHFGSCLAPHEDMVSAFDYTKLRMVTTNIAQNGVQHVGGFPASGVGFVVYRQWGSFRMPSGAATANMRVLAQQLATTDPTFALAYHSKLILARSA